MRRPASRNGGSLKSWARSIALWTLIAAETINAAPRAQTHTDRPVVPFEVIFQDLRQYGVWLKTDGRWAWRPNGIEHRWRPFSRGSWVITDYGWYWLSEYPWGWATSHYGRWEHSSDGRWVWRPGNEWAPAWVAWREGPQGIGWHPLPPNVPIPTAKGTAGGLVGKLGPEGWTFLLWRNVGDSLLPQVGLEAVRGRLAKLEAIQLSSATLTAATPDLLRQTRDVTRLTKKDDLVLNPGPDPVLFEAAIRRVPDACVIMHSKMRREILVIWRGRPILTVFRPVIKEGPKEIERFLTHKAELYRAIRERGTPPQK